MNIFFILLLATITLVLIINRYFKIEKKQCQKYPFFALRDRIVFELINNETNRANNEKFYKLLNDTINNLEEFNFKFYDTVLKNFLTYILEASYSSATKKFDMQTALDDLKINQLSKYEIDFFNLIIETAKQNSKILRLAMTNIGFSIHLRARCVSSLLKFTKKHPDIFRKKRQELELIQDYSLLSQKINHEAYCT